MHWCMARSNSSQSCVFQASSSVCTRRIFSSKVEILHPWLAGDTCSLTLHGIRRQIPPLKKGREFNCLKRLKNVKSIATDFFYSTRKAWFLEWLLVFWLKRSILDNPSNYLKINPRRISPFFLSYGSNNFFVDEK